MIRRTGPVIALAVVILAGCQSTGGDRAAATSAAARALATGLAEAIGRCWFGAPETAFQAYIYTPENVGGRPRILLAPKDDPTGRPVLVIEPGGATDVAVYGPLAESGLGPRIAADIDRWRSGGTACGS